MKWELETGIRKKFHLKFPTVSFCCSPSSLYHSFLIIVIVLMFYSVISIFYLLNLTLSPNKTFQLNFSNSFHPTTTQFLSGTFAKSLLDVVRKLGKRDLYPFIPSQLQLLILVLCFFFLFPSFSILQLPATSASLVLCNSPENGTSHSHPESTPHLLSPTSVPPHLSTFPENISILLGNQIIYLQQFNNYF